nr:hypothetical protein [Tanacetum cinerariifolium]
GSNDKKYTASTTKSKAARYELKGIEEMVPNIWSPRILSIMSVKVVEWYGYNHLEEIVVKRADQKLYTFKESAQGDAQSWISDLARQTDVRSSFNELLDTLIDFSNFIMNRLGVATLTPELLADQLDWVNPEGQHYPHNLLQPLPLIPDNQGRRVIPFKHFINNDLEYLRGGASSRKYTTSVTMTKAADYGHIKWIEDFVPRAMWIHEPINYDRHALWGVSHWVRKSQQFYGFAVNRESALDVYSKRRIIAITYCC